MPRPRKSLISLADTPYYHCVSRCVRRAFLCGQDKLTGQSYEHRRQWVEDRLLLLGSVFAIDICAYAVMSNHTHIVLYVDRELACQWATEEVLERWHRLHKGTLLTHRYLNSVERKAMSATQIESVESIASIYRARLHDISWFMRLLNEYIARQANKEDECTGRFWEGRFKSQALLDETSLAACMAYVDLNPIRAGMAKTPEQSCHTSIQKRLRAATNNKQPSELMEFVGHADEKGGTGIPFSFTDYFNLVEQTRRQFHSEPRSPQVHRVPLLDKSGLNESQWNWLIINIETQFSTRVSLAQIKRKLKQRRQMVA